MRKKIDKKCFLEYVDSAHALEGWISLKYSVQKEKEISVWESSMIINKK